MARLKVWNGKLVPIPKHAAYKDSATVNAAMEKKFGKNTNPFLPEGFGRQMIERRAKQGFPQLDKLPDPVGNFADGEGYRGLRIYKNDTHYGRCNGTVFPCNRKGCGGHRLLVVWPDGSMTQPCTLELIEYKQGRKIDETSVHFKTRDNRWRLRTKSRRTGRSTTSRKRSSG